MSEDKRKNARTQGRFLGGDKEYSLRQDKQSSKISPTDKNKGEKRKAPIGSRAQNEIDVQYEENGKYAFKDLEPVKKPQELRFSRPELVLSETDNGVSRLIYYQDFMKLAEADKYFEVLENTTAWYDKNIVIRGVEYPQPRLVAWYGPHPYTYAGATLEAREMPKAVLEIKEKVESTLQQCGIKVELNSVLLNLYRNGKDSVAWHSDDELSLGICPTIASVSLGESRKFEMRPKENIRGLDPEDKVYVNLTHGSLIVMDGCMQEDWLHRVPKEYHDKGPRINLTFRTIHPRDQLSPEMPRVSNVKSAKLPNEKEVHQQDPKFDTESFPPLGMEASDKKTKLTKENGSKDRKQPTVQKKSPKECWGTGDKKTKFSSKSYQQSVSHRKSQKEEIWDDKMLRVEDTQTVQDSLIKKSSHGSLINSPELHPSQIDYNSNVKEFSSRDFRRHERYSDTSEACHSHSDEVSNSCLLESEDLNPSENKSVDYNSNVEESAKMNNQPASPSSFINNEYQSGNSGAYQYNYEQTDNQLEFTDRSPSAIEPVETNIKISTPGKKSILNANAPVFLPQNRFENYSLSELCDLCMQLKNEDLYSFKDVIFKRLNADDSPFIDRDFYELDVYRKLMEDGSLSDKHKKIIFERIGFMIRKAYQRQNDTRYRFKYYNRSFEEHNFKRKQSYGRSPRY